MSEREGSNNEDLADLLWEKQEHPEDHSDGHWLEAEYLAHPFATFHRPADAENEADLRMRGLGALTQEEPPLPGTIVWHGEQLPEHERTSRLVLVSCLALAGVVIAAGALCWLSSKRRSARTVSS